MFNRRGPSRPAVWMIAGILALGVATNCAQGAPLLLTYTGAFNSLDALNLASAGSPSYFTAPTAFTVKAYFDTSSPNLAPPLPGPFSGFRAYAPSTVTMMIGSTLYRVDTIGANPLAGVAVAIFDRNSFDPGHYGVGIMQNPPADGAGIIGDFVSASPQFTAGGIVPTVFGDYFGVGYSSGICLVGTGDNCSLHAITPLVLHDQANVAYALTLGSYEEDYPSIHDSTPQNLLGPLNQARIDAVPEPGTFGLAGLALAGLLGLARRRG